MKSIPYHRIASQFYNRPLWLMPSAAETISAFLLTRIRQGRGSAGGEDDSGSATQFFPGTSKPDGTFELHRPRASRFYGEYKIGSDGTPKPYRETPEGTAILTVIGELANRGAYVGASSGIVTYEGFKYQVRQAAQDERIKSILIDMESPGGEATGAFEAAAVVREAAKVKPVYAVVNGLAASAGYALISGATRIVTPPTGVSGSIGVVMLHLDFSAQLDAVGVKPTFIHAGAHKVDGNPFEPLPAAVRERMQAEINSYYDQFVQTVAAGRQSMSVDAIRSTEALTYKGADAVSAGLADAVGTFEDVLSELSTPAPKRAVSEQHAPRDLGRGSANSRKAKDMKKTKRRRPAAQEGEAVVTLTERGDWETGAEYVVDDAVDSAGARYRCIEAHTSSDASEPGVGTEWETYWSLVEAAAEPEDTPEDAPAEASASMLARVRTEAAKAERARILGIEAIAVSGHDALVRAAKADGRTTPEQCAMQILQAEKQMRTAQANAIQAVETVTSRVPAAPVASVRTEPERSAAATTPDGWRAEYTAQDDKGAGLRKEFPSAETYIAYRNAESKGLVRRLVQRVA